MKYQGEFDKVEKRKEEISKKFKQYKKKRPKNLDDVFHDEHDKAFNDIDCLSCANCCKTTSPIFRDVDIARISKKLKMKQEHFEQQYLRKDEDGDWVLQSSPCHFLNADNTCFIYDIRPQACREYPHTDRKRMNQIMDLTLKNTEVCPAVARISLNVIDRMG